MAMETTSKDTIAQEFINAKRINPKIELTIMNIKQQNKSHAL